MSLHDGLTKKEGFKPEACSPPEVPLKGASRPKHEGKVTRTVKAGGK